MGTHTPALLYRERVACDLAALSSEDCKRVQINTDQTADEFKHVGATVESKSDLELLTKDNLLRGNGVEAAGQIILVKRGPSFCPTAPRLSA